MSDSPNLRYIVIEGIDASGKTTLCERLADALREQGFTALVRFEPTDGPFGRRIRALLSQQGSEVDVPGDEWMRLFLMDRAEHTKRIIRPALERNEWVVQDRSFYSTAAYQGAQGVDLDTILEENRAVAIEPSLVIVLDLPVEVAHQRIQRDREGELESLEERSYLNKVAAFFQQLDGPNIRHVDGTQDPDGVFEQSWQQVAAHWPEITQS